MTAYALGITIGFPTFIILACAMFYFAVEKGMID